ncbi:zinc finger protein 91 [Bicyclus anynana]|uniref:Zinc finger protein 91 n=1 Tax=Bicyclus anynana TaxID=110368 RepID=A0A6J1PB76_BICAN|nr:zinc finger protein 91 [Bicyclus anynana]
MMENYENLYNSICRLCLSFNDRKKMIPLIDKSNPDGFTPYAKAVSTFAHISFTNKDCLPKNMCPKCLYFLKHAIQFKLVTEFSDKCLKQLKKPVGTESENFKQKIIEFTMFKFYFPTECFKMKRECSINKKYSKGKSKATDSLEEDEEIKVDQFNCNNDMENDIFETLVVESDSEHLSQRDVKILDEIENKIGSNVCESPSPVFKRKKKRMKNKGLKARIHKLAMKHKSMRKTNLVCNVCNRVLANQLTYNHHMQRHTGCRYICEHCGKGFPVLNELQVHQVTKHDTGPYLQCSHCPFKAPRKFDLIEHERIHSGERPYTCEKCGLTFRRRGIWRKHLIYHSEKKVQCPQCPRKFFQRSDMLAHANNIHDRTYVYSCSKCGATYTKTETVRRHMTERHGIPREMQGKIIRLNKGASYQEY